MIDGNMKNNWEVCLATMAGYAEYKGLPGRVRTGCPNSPEYKSPFCCIHKPTVAVRQDTPLEDTPSSSGAAIQNTTPEEEPIGYIVSKRVTRN